MEVFTALLFFSAISFLFFGLGCFFIPRMNTEFIRYGLEKQRKIVGLLQLLAAFGLVIGYMLLPILTFISASGLAILMLLGFGVRLKIKDNIVQSFPAVFYAILNIYIAQYQWISL
ncbi:MAG: DoxX family protein [Saonia sp.]